MKSFAPPGCSSIPTARRGFVYPLDGHPARKGLQRRSNAIHCNSSRNGHQAPDARRCSMRFLYRVSSQ